ncbi:protein indeterminate-domain 7-like [Salvia miltiorrhiza]|uniref:protein indeterminate-domain 7-like n=1 Tax=Salvia miltiorrhiza TaxID=226208 RepID=UPI0025AC667C|nr:protein indeterminate-domain 7-like [Salvia miltiorrhiza]
MMKQISAIQEENISNLTSASNDASAASSTGGEMYPPPYFQTPPPPAKKKRSQPGHPDPGSEVISLSPRTLMATNRFVCEICNKGFQRDQNLQLHRRGHNLPWKLKQRSSKDVRKKVYVCPETTCVHHDPSRALGDLTGIKKHFCRKHGEKKWKCEKCSKKYAVQSDWKAHSKTCGTREYRCDCGTLFSRRDSFITHRAFCDALAEESAKSITPTPTIPLLQNAATSSSLSFSHHINLQQIQSQFGNAAAQNQELPFPIKKEHQSFTLRPPWLAPPPHAPPPLDLTTPSSIFQDFQENHTNHHNPQNPNPNPNTTTTMGPTTTTFHPFHHHPPPHISATALLQKAAEMGSKSSTSTSTPTPTPTTQSRPHIAHVPGFGLKLLAPRDHFINGALAPFGNNNKAAASSSPPSMLHDMMIHNQGLTTFEDVDDDNLSFAGILNNNNNNNSSSSSSKRVDESLDFDATLNHFSASNGGNHDDGMTRDFLGLRPLSQSDILSFAGLSSCMNTTSCAEHQSQTQRSWQG